MNKKIIIIGGDPNSINTEIIFKTWKKLNNNVKKNIYLISNFELVNRQFKKLKFKCKLMKIKNIDDHLTTKSLKIIDIPLDFKKPFNVSLNKSSKYVLSSLNLAHNLAKNKKVKGIINCAINKNLIKSSKKIGVTEYLASKCSIKKNSEIMMIFNKKLSVVPITTHVSIKDVSKKIRSKLIIKKIISLNENYKKIFNNKPKIGILGLNPHNAEFKKNSEEILEIIPAIKKLKQKKVNIKGPIVSDTIFVAEYKKFDVIVGMYHDQVLSPFKTLFNFNAINITLGLNYIRLSPDHGPAIDIIGKNKADCTSLLNCVNFISNLKR
tara:strand:- start:798 stop:1766 length:969 start_codon:yes stop_codon:yes gene_type:complete